MLGSGTAVGGVVPLLAAPGGAPHPNPKKGHALARHPVGSLGGAGSPSPSHKLPVGGMGSGGPGSGR